MIPLEELTGGACRYTWSWRVFDSYDHETCGSPSIAVDLASDEPRCGEHLADDFRDPWGYGPAPIARRLSDGAYALNRTTLGQPPGVLTEEYGR